MYLVESKTTAELAAVQKAMASEAMVSGAMASEAVASEAADPDRDSDPHVVAYYDLRDRVIQERDAGNVSEALRLSREALDLANEIGCEALSDQAYCNWYGFVVLLGQEGPSPSRLRTILMRSKNRRISFTAAYHLACDYTWHKQHKKALFYAQIARQHALALGNLDLIVRSHNEMGRCYLSDSYFDKAVGEYEEALRVMPGELSVLQVPPLGNLGYTKLIQGDYREGFKHLYRGLRRCRSNSSERAHEEWFHLYLCYGHIEIRRWRYAWSHGRSGLELAEEHGNSDAVKNALYLLGEVEKSAGDIEAAHEYFLRLQHEFYPENKGLAKMMLFCETRDLVNLRA